MSWYRIHRPQTVAALHLTSVREELLRIMATGQIPHALLFTGPKGTGKTSSARILAKAVNCEKKRSGSKKGLGEPCNTCAMCQDITAGRSMNVVEIDAASNRRIDDIRDLKERIYTPPPIGKTTVYIVDEVHMLTTEAFNAFLKILEEPPAHAIFILATTELHKLPETIISRCRVVQFHKASVDELVAALQNVCAAESLTAQAEALAGIARVADGSFRDAVKILETVAQGAAGSLSLQDVQRLLPTLQMDAPEVLLQAILAKDELAIVKYFASAIQSDVDAPFLHKQLLACVHEEFLKSIGISEGESIAPTAALQYIFKQFSSVTIDDRVPLPLVLLEMTALEMVLKSKAQHAQGGGGGSPKISPARTVAPTSTPAASVAVSAAPQSKVTLPAHLVDTPSRSDVIESVTPVIQSQDSESLRPPATGDGSLLQEKWEDFLRMIGSRNISLEALLRSSKFVRGEQGKAQVQVFYQFHKQQLEVERYRSIVQDCAMAVLGGLVKVEYVFEVPSQDLSILGSADNNVSGSVSPEVAELISLAEDALL